MFAILDRIIENSKVAVLATVDQHGGPSLRWMTPTLLRGRDESLFTVTGPSFRKMAHINGDPHVQWIFQTKALDEVLNVSGTIHAIESPRTKAEVLESVGRNLSIFWKINTDETELLVLETRITAYEYFKPLTGERTSLTVS